MRLMRAEPQLCLRPLVCACSRSAALRTLMADGIGVSAGDASGFPPLSVLGLVDVLNMLNLLLHPLMKLATVEFKTQTLPCT